MEEVEAGAPSSGRFVDRLVHGDRLRIGTPAMTVAVNLPPPGLTFAGGFNKWLVDIFQHVESTKQFGRNRRRMPSIRNVRRLARPSMRSTAGASVESVPWLLTVAPVADSWGYDFHPGWSSS